MAGKSDGSRPPQLSEMAGKSEKTSFTLENGRKK
jgi:hypothetical protein